MELHSIIGKYNSFYSAIITNLGRIGIDVSSYDVSHLGFKAETLEEYNRVRDALLGHCSSMIENTHNDRPIAKMILREPLQLGPNHEVTLLEIMPPKKSGSRKYELEHCGFVVGNGLDDFKSNHAEVLTGTQDQGPYCQPAFVVFDDNTRVKFYEHGLKEVVELEGHTFVGI